MQSPLAYEGLTEEIELGALLPCNVIVYENDDGDIVVSAVDPEQLVGIADNDALDSIATEVNGVSSVFSPVSLTSFEPASEV